MPSTVTAPGFQVEIDDTELRQRFSRQRFGRAVNNALRAVGVDYANRLFDGFKAEGVDPQSGRKGFWPKLKIPAGPTRAGGRTKRGKILKKSGAYLKSVEPKNARIVIRGNPDNKTMSVRYDQVPDYAQYHETGVRQTASARQAAFLRHLGYLGAHEGSIINMPARRVFVYPPTWRGVSARIFKRELAKLWESRNG